MSGLWQKGKDAIRSDQEGKKTVRTSRVMTVLKKTCHCCKKGERASMGRVGSATYQFTHTHTHTHTHTICDASVFTAYEPEVVLKLVIMFCMVPANYS